MCPLAIFLEATNDSVLSDRVIKVDVTQLGTSKKRFLFVISHINVNIITNHSI